MHFKELNSPAKRQIYKICLSTLLLALMVSAATIPFMWESESMWYKIGIDKTLLRSGKIVGICAAILLFMQIILALKLKFLDRIFGLDKLYRIHKLGGLTILCLAISHAFLILIPEGLTNLPIGWKFWPEMLGAAILLLLIAFVGTALFRRRLMAYHLWRQVHRPMGYLFAVALSIHIFNVSDSFETSVPKYGLWALIGVVLLVVIPAKVRSFYALRKRLPIQGCSLLNDNVLSLNVFMPTSFTHAPGQLVFLRLYGDDITPEPHPFTISSAPCTHSDENYTLQCCIKKSGDWTDNIGPEKIQEVSVEGPFGLFSYRAQPPADLLVFIAAGIGITPLLSMLRQLSCEKNPPRILLLWSLSWKKDMFLNNELESLQKKLSTMNVHIFYTREPGGKRIGQEQLGQLLESVPEKTQFYICGPEMMIEQSRRNLKDLGFMTKNIFSEQFAL